MDISYGEWDNAARLVYDSVAFRFVNGLTRGYLAGAAHSTIAARVRRAVDASRTLTPVSRVRSLALMVGVAATAHQVLVGLVPPGSRPRLPRALDVIVAVVAFAAIAGAGPLVTASRSSLVLRWLRSVQATRPRQEGVISE